MPNICSFFLSVLLAMSLTGCVGSGPVTSENLIGLWTDGNARLYSLDADGILGLPQENNISGVSWNFDGNALTLKTLALPEGKEEESVLTLRKKNLFSLEFVDPEGRSSLWRKSSCRVERLDGVLYYRERMILPPRVVISTQLWSEDEKKLLASSLRPADGQTELCFRIHCLGDSFKKAAKLSASVFYGSEVLFTTPEKIMITPGSSPSVLLHHAVPSPESSPSLTGTHWRLVSLNDSPVIHYPDQPEAHLILNSSGEVSGSDGCNNFFMNWSGEEQSIRFSDGGSTLRLCPQGEEQAQAMRTALHGADSWKLNGSRLHLMKEGKNTAVFEAVDM